MHMNYYYPFVFPIIPVESLFSKVRLSIVNVRMSYLSVTGLGRSSLFSRHPLTNYSVKNRYLEFAPVWMQICFAAVNFNCFCKYFNFHGILLFVLLIFSCKIFENLDKILHEMFTIFLFDLGPAAIIFLGIFSQTFAQLFKCVPIIQS